MMPIELEEASIVQLMAESAECYEASRWFRDRLAQWGIPADAPASVREASVAAEISRMQRSKLFALLDAGGGVP